MKKIYLLIFSVLGALIITHTARGQCTTTTANGGTIAPTAGSTWTDFTNTNRGPGLFYEFSATAGRIYSFRTQGASNWTDPYLTISNSSNISQAFNDNNGPYYTDNCSGGENFSSLDWLAPSSGTYRVHVMRGGCVGWFSGNGSAVLQYRQTTPPAITFGNNVWRVYAFNAADRGLSPNQAPFGYYEDTNLNINSTNRWASSASPSSATGWVGTEVPIDNHTVVYKRQGFPCGTYTVQVAFHDDDARLLVNGTQVWDQTGCCADRGIVWTGNLDASSTMEFRVQEGCGGSNLTVTLLKLDNWSVTASASPSTLCEGDDLSLSSSVSGTLPWVNCSSGCGIPSHCTATYSNTSDDWIQNITFNTINNNSGSVGYENYTGLSTTVIPGQTYNLSVNVRTLGYNQYVRAYFDWNRNGTYEAGEYYDLGNSTADPFITNANITIPSGASAGTTRMRIIEDWNGYSPTNGCISDTYGEAEDYSINILAQPTPTYSWTGPATYSSSSQNPTRTNIPSNGGGTYTVTATAGGCSVSDDVVVMVDQLPTVANAGPDQYACLSPAAVMAANNPTVGTGAWTWSGPGSVSYQGGTSNADYNAEILFSTSGSYTGTWTISNGVCTASTDNVTVEVNNPDDVILADATASCDVSINGWVHLYNSSGKILASINSNGQNLGEVTVELFYNGGNARTVTATGSCNQNQAVMNRNFVINSTNAPSSAVSIRLYFTDDELAKLIDLSLTSHSTYPSTSVSVSDPNGCQDNDDAKNINEVYVTQISGSGSSEDGSFDPGVGTFVLHVPINSGTGDNNFGANYVQFDVTQFSEFWLHGSEHLTPLPVELLKFTAKAVDNTIQLHWATATEINNEGFEVQRSTDAWHWSSIGWVPGNGNANVVINYSFDDAEVSRGSTYYYRLKQIDYDGAFEYSPITSAALAAGNHQILVYPNPTSDYITVEIMSDESHIEDLFFTNVIGVTVMHQKIALNKGYNTMQLDISSLSDGVYHLKVYDYTMKIIVAK